MGDFAFSFASLAPMMYPPWGFILVLRRMGCMSKRAKIFWTNSHKKKESHVGKLLSSANPRVVPSYLSDCTAEHD